MTTTHERHFARAPRDLVATLLDEAYLAARGDALGGTAPATLTYEGEIAVVRFPRRLPLDDVPAPLRALAGSGEIVQVERWETITDERCAAVWTTESALPGRMNGTYEVTATGDGSVYRVVSTAKVNVPLIGGKLAGEVEGHSSKLIEAEFDFLARWLDR